MRETDLPPTDASSPTRGMRDPRALRNRTLLGELWGFLLERKAWWLIPTVLTLVLLGGLIIMTHSTVVSSYIYMLF